MTNNPYRAPADNNLHKLVLKELGRLTWLRIFRRHIGDVYLPDKVTRIQVGVPGQADLYGFAAPLISRVTYAGVELPTPPALHFEIETKAPRGGLSPPQRAWRNVCLELGVLHVTARSLEDVYNAFRERGYGDRLAPVVPGSGPAPRPPERGPGRARARLGPDPDEREGPDTP